MGANAIERTKRAALSPEPEHRLWTLYEVAVYLRVSRATVRRWTNTGRLCCYRLGGSGGRRLFSPEQIREFLARHEVASR